MDRPLPSEASLMRVKARTAVGRLGVLHLHESDVTVPPYQQIGDSVSHAGEAQHRGPHLTEGIHYRILRLIFPGCSSYHWSQSSTNRASLSMGLTSELLVCYTGQVGQKRGRLDV
jgi:hypothetical protein